MQWQCGNVSNAADTLRSCHCWPSDVDGGGGGGAGNVHCNRMSDGENHAKLIILFQLPQSISLNVASAAAEGSYARSRMDYFFFRCCRNFWGSKTFFRIHRLENNHNIIILSVPVCAPCVNVSLHNILANIPLTLMSSVSSGGSFGCHFAFLR